MWYKVYGYDTPEGEEYIVAFPHNDVEKILEIDQEAYDRWGYSVGQYDTLEEALAVYPRAKLVEIA